jgi:hypothetical protein
MGRSSSRESIRATSGIWEEPPTSSTADSISGETPAECTVRWSVQLGDRTGGAAEQQRRGVSEPALGLGGEPVGVAQGTARCGVTGDQRSVVPGIDDRGHHHRSLTQRDHLHTNAIRDRGRDGRRSEIHPEAVAQRTPQKAAGGGLLTRRRVTKNQNLAVRTNTHRAAEPKQFRVGLMSRHAAELLR